jgi:hypothetical protein
LIDARGHLRYVHFGEGDYEAGEQAVRSLLAEAGRAGLGPMTRVQAERAARGVRTPESYLGAARAQGFVNGLFGDPVTPGHHFFRPPPGFRLPPNSLAYRGGWTIFADGATAGPRARLDLRFQARRVFLVMGSPEAAPVRVLLDGEPLPDRLSGDDVRAGTAEVDEQRLYRLVDLPRVERHLLTLEFAPGISGYAFTFG